MYTGPIIDTFFHGPWLRHGDRPPREDWADDPRLQRVMRTFQHGKQARRKTAAELLADMDRAGVEKALLIAKLYYPATVDEVRALHEELAAMAAHAPDRLKCVGTIQPPEQGPGTYWDVLRNNRLVEEAYRDYGFIGVHLTPSPWGIAPNDRWFYPLYTKCVELGLTVFTYVGMPAALWPMYPNHPLHLDDVALAFPDLRIVAHHIGDPWVDVIVRLAAKHPNIYICTSAWSPKRYPAELMRFMREGWHRQPGTEKVMFGSDYPLLDLKKTTDDARRLDLPEDGLRQFLYETAKRLFWGEEE